MGLRTNLDAFMHFIAQKFQKFNMQLCFVFNLFEGGVFLAILIQSDLQIELHSYNHSYLRSDAAEMRCVPKFEQSMKFL